MEKPYPSGERVGLLRQIAVVLWQFVQGQLLVALADGAAAGVGFWLLGLDHVLWLAAAVGLFSFIPYLGPVLGFVPALILAVVTQQPWWIILGVVGLWLLVQLLEAAVFQPKILGGKLRLPPLVVMLSFVVWGLLLGPIGVLLAVPMTAVAVVLWRRWRGEG